MESQQLFFETISGVVYRFDGGRGKHTQWFVEDYVLVDRIPSICGSFPFEIDLTAAHFFDS